MAENKPWKKVESEMYKFEKEGDSIEGKLVNKEKSQIYENMNYDIEVKGKNITIFGSTALDTQMRRIEVGSEVKIVFKGEKKSEKTGRMYKDFEVFHK